MFFSVSTLWFWMMKETVFKALFHDVFRVLEATGVINWSDQAYVHSLKVQEKIPQGMRRNIVSLIIFCIVFLPLCFQVSLVYNCPFIYSSILFLFWVSKVGGCSLYFLFFGRVCIRLVLFLPLIFRQNLST